MASGPVRAGTGGRLPRGVASAEALLDGPSPAVRDVVAAVAHAAISSAADARVAGREMRSGMRRYSSNAADGCTRVAGRRGARDPSSRPPAHAQVLRLAAPAHR